MAPPRTNRVSSASLNAPSGIAQLRKTSEQALPQPEPMNLDDFINSDNAAATPAPLDLTPTPESMRRAEEKSAHATAAAIPIAKPRKEQPSQHLVPQSVPVAAHQRVQDEFGYLPRHPRKTSIDEIGQRVSSCLLFRKCEKALDMAISSLFSCSLLVS